MRYIYVHLYLGASLTETFSLEPFVSARIFATVGDEAHHKMDAIDPG